MPTLRETQVSEQVHSASAELLERAGYIRKVRFVEMPPSLTCPCSLQLEYTTFSPLENA